MPHAISTQLIEKAEQFLKNRKLQLSSTDTIFERIDAPVFYDGILFVLFKKESNVSQNGSKHVTLFIFQKDEEPLSVFSDMYFTGRRLTKSKMLTSIITVERIKVGRYKVTCKDGLGKKVGITFFV